MTGGGRKGISEERRGRDEADLGRIERREEGWRTEDVSKCALEEDKELERRGR